ncbi:hypothetical protein DERP_010083 [Dermatophagoides pteronyssinus]|uniref:Uncharacterized protein n=1 Tax=Dermatophagoides pteronyssinus TaxID=6956 RepID=A0ABQ8JFD4_DERPT|nr:hypothetical protein DERP_010083 [Dermatophagoides pteronyssinus]
MNEKIIGNHYYDYYDYYKVPDKEEILTALVHTHYRHLLIIDENSISFLNVGNLDQKMSLNETFLIHV